MLFPHVMHVLDSRWRQHPFFTPEISRLVFQYTLFNPNEHTLFRASNQGNLPVVQYLLNELNDAEVAVQQKNHALCRAVENGHLPVIQYMLEHGADVRADEDLPLLLAASAGRMDIIECLVNHGANIRAPGVLCWAGDSGNLEVVKYFMQYCDDGNNDVGYALCSAADNGHFDTVVYLNEHSSVSIPQHDIDTATFWAADKGYLDIVMYLVEQAGADIHMNNELALRQAVESGHLPVVQYLLAHGANVHVGIDCVETAVYEHHEDIVVTLVEHGAYIRAETLNLAYRISSPTLVDYLINHYEDEEEEEEVEEDEEEEEEVEEGEDE